MTRSRMHLPVGAASAPRADFFQRSTGASRVLARSRAAKFASIAVALLALAAALAASAQASLLSPTGSFGSAGSGAGQFQSPLGVAVQASSGNVFVVDSQNRRIEKFSASGSFITAFGQDQLSSPTTIATDNWARSTSATRAQTW